MVEPHHGKQTHSWPGIRKSRSERWPLQSKSSCSSSWSYPN